VHEAVVDQTAIRETVKSLTAALLSIKSKRHYLVNKYSAVLNAMLTDCIESRYLGASKYVLLVLALFSRASCVSLLITTSLPNANTILRSEYICYQRSPLSGRILMWLHSEGSRSILLVTT
jgi:hypothetical protein